MSENSTNLHNISDYPFTTMGQNFITFVHERLNQNFCLTVAMLLCIMYFIWSSFQSRPTQNRAQGNKFNKSEAREHKKVKQTKILMRIKFVWVICCIYLILVIWDCQQSSKHNSPYHLELLWFCVFIPLYFLFSEETTIGMALIYVSFLITCYFFRALVSAVLLSGQIIFCILNEGKISEQNLGGQKQVRKATNLEQIQTEQKTDEQKISENNSLYFQFSACILLAIIYSLLEFVQPHFQNSKLIILSKPLIAVGYFLLVNLYSYQRYYKNYYHLSDQTVGKFQPQLFSHSRIRIRVFNWVNLFVEILMFIFNLQIGSSLFPESGNIIFLIEVPFIANLFVLAIWQKINNRKLMLRKKYESHMKKMWILRIFMLSIFMINGYGLFIMVSICCTFALYIQELSHLFQKEVYKIPICLSWEKKTLLIICMYLINYVHIAFTALLLIGFYFCNFFPYLRTRLGQITNKILTKFNGESKMKKIIPFSFLVYVIWSFSRIIQNPIQMQISKNEGQLIFSENKELFVEQIQLQSVLADKEQLLIGEGRPDEEKNLGIQANSNISSPFEFFYLEFPLQKGNISV